MIGQVAQVAIEPAGFLTNYKTFNFLWHVIYPN